MSDLPTGWTNSQLGNVAEWGSGGTPSRNKPEYYGGKIPWIKTGELAKGIIRDTEEKITELGLKNSSAKIFKRGSVAIALYGATIGKTSILGIDAATNQACAVGLPIEGLITTEYLHYYLMSQKDGFVNSGQGGAQPNISQAIIKNWVIPLAPLNEQKRIAEKLDSLLARVDSCQSHLECVPQVLKRFRQSVLAAARSGRLTEDWREKNSTQQFEFEYILEARKRAWKTNEVRKQVIKGISPDNNLIKNYAEPVELENSNDFEKPDDWIFVSTDQITFLITDGKHGDCKNEPNSGYYFLSVKDLYQGNLHYEDARQIRKEDFLEVHYRTNLEKGDVLVTNAGTIGRVAVARDETKASRTTFQKSVAILKPVKEVVLSDYLAMYIESSVTWLVEKSSGTAVKNLLLRDLRTITIALPSLEEQAEIVRRVEKLFAYAERLEARYYSASEHVERLTPSLLAKAFRGELVEQDAEDESASALVERIRGQREDKVKETPRGEKKVKPLSMEI